MFGAGMPPPEDTGTLDAIRGRLASWEKALTRLSEQAQRAKTGVEGSTEEFVEGRERVAEARGEEVQADGRVNSASGLWDSVRAAGETIGSFTQTMRDEWVKLGPERTEVGEAFKLAHFFKEYFERDFFNAVIRAQLEAITENQINSLKLAVFLIGRAFKDSSSIALGRAAPLELDRQVYLRPEQPRSDDSIQKFVQARSQANGLAGRERALAEREAQGKAHYEEVLAKKKRELAEAQTQLAEAKSKKAAADGEAERLKGQRDAARREFEIAIADVKAKQAEGQKINEEYQKAAEARQGEQRRQAEELMRQIRETRGGGGAASGA